MALKHKSIHTPRRKSADSGRKTNRSAASTRRERAEWAARAKEAARNRRGSVGIYEIEQGRARDISSYRGRVGIYEIKQSSSDSADPTATPDLRLTRRALLLFCLALPLVAAFLGFASKSATLPDPPKALTEPARRGAILGSDGTVLAEGAVEHRRYPQGTLAANVIGFSGAEQPDGRFGLEGLEFSLEDRLAVGENVTLTLDPSLQAVAQAEVKRAVRAFRAESGAAVMIETGTGRILAAASFPDYDPNHQGRVRDRGDIVNRAFLQQIEPGSTMKPFVVAALLQDGRVKPGEIIDTPMTLRVGDKTFRDVAQHEETLPLKDVLRYSSNSGMIHLGERFSSPELYEWYRRYGFGESVNLTYAYDRSGQLRAPEGWVPQDHASATIGQSLTTTELQLATAYSIFANDGLYVPPRLVEDEPWRMPHRVLSPEVARAVRSMLVHTVEESGLKVAKIPGVLVGGKSGTADVFDPSQGRYVDDEYTMHFAGFFPADAPRVTLAVFVHKPKLEGATSTFVAAPLFGAIGRETVALWGLPPQGDALAHAP